MQKFLFIPLILFFASCIPTGNPRKKEVAAKFRATTFPAVQKMADYRREWQRAQLEATLWVEVPGESESKLELKKFVANDYPKMKSDLKEMEQLNLLTKDDGVDELISLMDTEISAYKEIMEGLSNVQQYNDPSVMFPMQDRMLNNEGDCVAGFRSMDNRFEKLTEKINTTAQQQLDEIGK